MTSFDDACLACGGVKVDEEQYFDFGLSTFFMGKDEQGNHVLIHDLQGQIGVRAWSQVIYENLWHELDIDIDESCTMLFDVFDSISEAIAFAMDLVGKVRL